MRMVRTAVGGATVALLVASLSCQQPAHNKQPVKFKSGQLTLVGSSTSPMDRVRFPPSFGITEARRLRVGLRARRPPDPARFLRGAPGSGKRIGVP